MTHPAYICCFIDSVSSGKQSHVSHKGMWAVLGVWTSRREVFFFSACHFRGIRDDIEEEDEQVSEPFKILNPLHRWSKRSPDQTSPPRVENWKDKACLLLIYPSEWQNNCKQCLFVFILLYGWMSLRGVSRFYKSMMRFDFQSHPFRVIANWFSLILNFFFHIIRT